MEAKQYTTKAGVKQFKPVATESEVMNGDLGFCLGCGAEAGPVEPDARKYPCGACGAKKVYGLEELLMMDLVEIAEE